MSKYLFDISPLTTKNDYGKYSEEFQTPPAVCEYMASLVPDTSKTVLEPTLGQGNLVTALGDRFDVTAPDDFFQLEKKKFDGLKSLTSLPRKTFEYARIQTVVMELHKGYEGETLFKVFDF